MRLLIAGAPSKIFHLKEFGEELKKQGHEYHLVTDTDIYTGFPSRKITNWFDTKTKFKKLISNFSPDAVFVDRQVNFGKIVIEEKIPLFVHLRGDYWSESEMAKQTLYKYPPKRTVIWFKEQTADKCFQGATKIFPICKYLSNLVSEHYPEKPNHVFYQGIKPTNWFSDEKMELKHPCVGLLQSATIWEKTKQLLLLKNILKKMPDVTFYWAGDGVYREKILPELQKFKNFKWLGQLEYPSQVRKFLSSIDIYALISGIDMSPLSLQEAQLMNKPVIATNVGGIPELMINNQTGFLVKKDNESDLYEKLNKLVNDQEMQMAFGKNGQKFVGDTFNCTVITKNFLDIVTKTID